MTASHASVDAVAGERALAVGPVQVCRGVGAIDLRDEEVGHEVEAQAQDLGDGVAVFEVSHRVELQIVRGVTVQRPVVIGGSRAGHADEVLVAEHRRARTSRGGAHVEQVGALGPRFHAGTTRPVWGTQLVPIP